MNNSSVAFNIDKNIAVWLGENDVQIEDVFVLLCIADIEDNLETFNNYLRHKTPDQKLVYLQKLVRKQWIDMEYDIEEYSIDNYTVSEEGRRIINFLKGREIIKSVELVNLTSKEEVTGFVDSKVIIDKEKENKFDKFVEEFRNKFPEGKNGGGVSFKGNPIDVKNKLHKFMNKYKKYTMETILLATDLYLNGFKRKGYEFCQAAEYFILKNQTSTLAGFCELVLKNKEGGVGSVSNPFEQTM